MRHSRLAKIMMLMGGGAGSDPLLDALLAKFKPTGQYAFISQYGTTTPIISIYHQLYQHICVEYAMSGKFEVSANTPGILNVYQSFLLAGVRRDDVGMTYANAGNWTFGTSASYYLGYYGRTTTTGEYVQWTSPAGTTVIHSWSITGATNAGVCLVTIDGDNTLANRLPTAQELVDAGTLANTVLVANGGSLNPTDRVWNQYNNAAAYGGKTLADNLTAGAHTIRLTCTGYKQAASSDVRMYFSGFSYWNSSITPATSNLFVFRDTQLSGVESRWEFAHSYKPTGASGAEFIGHTNTVKTTALPKCYVDGVEVTPAQYTFNGGTEAKIVVEDLQLDHSEDDNIGNADLTYTITAENGLVITHTITWTTAGEVTYCYPAMFPVASTLVQKGSNYGGSTDVTLDQNDGSLVAQAKSQAVYMWSAAGNYGACLYIPNLATTVNNFADCESRYFHIEDRSGGVIEKIYLVRSDGPLAIAENTVWNSEAHYRINYFPDGADAALARPA